MAQHAVANNGKRIAHMELPGGGQVIVDGDYAYVGHMAPPHGTSIIDVADPRIPREMGSFIPEPVAGDVSPQSSDVEVDERGLIYLIDRNNGFDILEFEA